MRYILMNKNKEITSFDVGASYASVYMVSNAKKCDRKSLPYGYLLHEEKEDINLGLSQWLSNRSAAEHNSLSDRVISMQHLYDPKEFIRHTHAASLNDTFWVREETEKISWEEVSLYRKQYNPLVSQACLGVAEAMRQIKTAETDLSCCPELLHNGSFPRMFRNTDDGILFYKSGSDESRSARCEVLSAEISKAMNNGAYYVPYAFTQEFGKDLCYCKWFTDESTGLVTPYTLLNGRYPTIGEVFEMAQKYGCEAQYRRMLVLDALTFNRDRHLNNFGFLMDNDTLEIKGFAPFFDQNKSLFGDLRKEDFEHISRHIYYRRPRIGRDFTGLGRWAITEEIAKDLEGMRDFSFTFRGDDTMPDWMVEGVENTVRRQIEGLLDLTIPENEVFARKKTEEELMKEKYERAVFRANTIKRILDAFLAAEPDLTEYDTIVHTDADAYMASTKITAKDGSGEMIVDTMAWTAVSSGKEFEQVLQDKIYQLIMTFQGSEE